MTVTFFGHRDAPDSIAPILENVLLDIVKSNEETTFLIGNNGAFDGTVLSVVRKMKLKYENCNYMVVLAYMPTKNSDYDPNETVLPESVAAALPRYAISKRNIWMLNMSDTVVTYVKRSYGGAARYKRIAASGGKGIIELTELRGSTP